MYADEAFPGGGGFEGPWCRSCKGTIQDGEPLVRVHFDSDPQGAKELSGPYHAACGKPFASIARALSMLSRFGN